MGSLIACAPAQAISANQYQSIVERNAFGLNPRVAGPTQKPPVPTQPKIILTGITTILGDKRVLMKVQFPATPPQQPNEQSFILREGEKQGDIEVLEINEQAGTARLLQAGSVLTLSLERDGARLPSTPPPGTPSPSAPAQPAAGQVVAPPAAQPYGFKTLPTRNRPPQAPGTPLTQSTSAALQRAPVQMTPEEQALLQEVERQSARTNPAYPPLPQPPVPLAPQ